jgi:hypothetical protein
VADCVIATAATPPEDFSEVWDCSAPNGFTTISLAGLELSACKALEQDGFDPGRQDCQQQRFEETQQDPNSPPN